ncbi:PEP/pyruvate-binding domain-containing protein [Amycolatopsis alba]|uniref:Phosphoenolpyruvate synthase n=1 Tax=Amycolatopsis alba DSM 44262 TaxID=1125972 RepID=A0A229REY8_AMYAL|nr:PEP/pyruvate-binding domain-containing protein [Amycolatopsis alba]OXM45207.1 hypothetical protein CFP75_31955 [Amycolatopsis alba DSM 44262]
MIELSKAADLTAAEVGGKARMLGLAIRQGFSVPAGVVLLPGEPPDSVELERLLGPGPFAVRSSAPDEDGSDESQAGRYDTRLDVRTTGLAAVVDELGRIPLIVQALVAAKTAGVAFSLDPLTGDDSTCVIESVPGRGNALTDGEVTPATLRASLLTGRLRGSLAGSGLGQDEATAVIELVRAVAGWLGYPCDLEWAFDDERLWLLQARPVTAARWQPLPGQWTSANFRETMPGLVTPLSASITLGRVFPQALTEFLRDIGLEVPGRPVVEGRRCYGHAYWRVDEFKKTLLQLPGYIERSFDEGLGLVPGYHGQGERWSPAPATIRRVPKIVLAVWRQHRRILREAMAYQAGDAGRDRRWLAVAWADLADPELRTEFHGALRLHERTYRQSLRVSFMAEQLQELLRALLEQVGGRLDEPPRELLLMDGLGPLATGAAGRALEELAGQAADMAEEVLAAAETEALPDGLGTGLAALSQEFGYLADGDDELARPRWDEDPGTVLLLLKAAVRAAQAGPRAVPPEHARSRAEEERRVLRAAGPWTPVLRGVLGAAREYSRTREVLRVSATRANRILRRACLGLGGRWAELDLLDAPDDVFWLTLDEVLRALDDDLEGGDFKARVRMRREHARCFRNWEPPSALGAMPVRPSPVRGRTLTGIACSAGVAEGPVRILRSVAEIGDFEAGGILVVQSVNPGWAPAYLAASGLVTEQGGLLSHGSILARERSLPAVIAVGGVLERLRDGQLVRVDGTEGTVTVLS